MFEMKEQDKISEELSEVETGNLPEKELKVMIVKMIKELNGWIEWDIRSFKQRLWKYEEQPNRDEEYNNWNEKHIRRKQQ